MCRLRVWCLLLCVCDCNVPVPPAGGDLRQVGPALRGSVPAPGGAELPSHRHPQGHGPGGEVGVGSIS